MTTLHSTQSESSQPQTSSAQTDSIQGKRPYQRPTLKYFGTVAELTQASSGPCAIDGSQGFCIMLNMARDG